MNNWRLIIDVNRCEDCNNCLLACKDEHVGNDWPGYSASQPLHGHHWIEIRHRERGEFPRVDVAFLPLTCMHCGDAPCVDAGRGAVRRRPDGIVIIDPRAGRGRRDIVSSCPYGVISWNEAEELPQKCTLCAHLLDDGWSEPRCVRACPTGALQVIRCDDADMVEWARRDGLDPYRPELGTAPRVLYRNLQRFTSARLSGSVTHDHEGVTDCVEGANVELRVDDQAQRGTVTDTFGDYAFDGLSHDAREYRLRVTLPGHVPAEVRVSPSEGGSAGTIHLERLEGEEPL